METEILWVPKGLAAEIKALGDITELTEGQTKGIIKRMKADIETYQDCLDDDVLQFRAHAEKVRNSYKKVVDEEMERTYEFWDALEIKKVETAKRLEESKKLTRSISDDLKHIQTALNSANIYGIKDLLELVEQVKHMPAEDRELLQGLLDIKRRG
jgi:hypothetical protein